MSEKKLYFEIKESVLKRADHTRELSNSELKPCFEEISVNGPTRISYEKAGELYRYDKMFSGEEELEDLIQTICAGGNRMVNEASPIVDTRLPDGSRVKMVLKPIWWKSW